MPWRRPVRTPADVTGPRSDFARDHALAVRLGLMVGWAMDHGRDLDIVNPLTAELAWVGYSASGRREHAPQRGAEALTAIATKMQRGLTLEVAVEQVAEEWMD